MINLSRLISVICLAFAVSNCQQLLPFGSYQNDIGFPALRGEFHTSTQLSQQPIHQVSAGFHLNPQPPLPFLQSFPLNPALFPLAKNAFRSQQDPYFSYRRFLSPPFYNLFTPTTIREIPESTAQQDEYRKALKEEAEEAEKEQNDITTNFENLAESTSFEPNGADRKTFVRVNVQGKDYSYST